jgi:hypothetical protein
VKAFAAMAKSREKFGLRGSRSSFRLERLLVLADVDSAIFIIGLLAAKTLV